MALPDTVEVCAIQLPGRANRFLEPARTRVSDIVDDLGPSLTALLEKPFLFFGHSMGAILSFEIARWLRRRGKPLPRRLVVSGRRAPQIPDTEPFRHLLNDEEFISSLSELNGMPEELMSNAELLHFALPTLRADVKLVETYDYRKEPPLACPITALAGTDDSEESAELVERWRLQTTRTFTIHKINGDHFYVHSNKDEVLKILEREVRSAVICS